ncbi:hypothetical protein RchiOBHm_Chr7g0243261 [Rosa chinensis]|uniref:Uncharacterized protein n=1 Tax=Rosa chinensis TaxID=74649 RepID=A0A2P6PIP5_ROSCH|nr:hypothetical protein RchiOBHm_Chr7g0243261 [Rosa chinensis]
MAALLSQKRFIACLGLNPKSFSKLRSHNISQTPWAIPLYSASALDLATTFCFLLLHVTRLPSTNVKYTEVDLLSVIHLAQSASVYPATSK